MYSRTGVPKQGPQTQSTTPTNPYQFGQRQGLSPVGVFVQSFIRILLNIYVDLL